MGAGAKATVSENLANGSALTDACLGVNVFSTATKNTASLACDAAKITVTGTPAAKGVILTFSPTTVAGSINWSCKVTGNENNKYAPAECRI
jgi:metal-dependent amidase/aminoacylase/carboxypeptidase family protein